MSAILSKINKEVYSPPADAMCEAKYGKGYNRGYEIGHGQAKCTAKGIARYADDKITALESENAKLKAEVAELKHRGGAMAGYIDAHLGSCDMVDDWEQALAKAEERG